MAELAARHLLRPCDGGESVPRSVLWLEGMRYAPPAMERPLLRTLARCRRLLLEVHALPAGTLPPELDHAIEDLLMPGFRDRVFTVYLANMPDDGTLPS